MSSINEVCVGPSSEDAGKAASCEGCPNKSTCSSGAAKIQKEEADSAAADVQLRMATIKHKILVLSGKGGVGKSTCSAQLAFALAASGFQVGLLDVDICGPSIPQMLGLVGHEVHQSASGWSPVYVDDNLGVMSIGFMLPSNDDAVIWRGPRKSGLIKQFLTDVVWNDLDYLIIDTPPGTSDEHLSIVQYLKSTKIDGAIVVTTPQEIAMADVRKELNFCKKTGIRVLGVIENMADLRIPLSMLSHSQHSGLRLLDSSGNDATSDIIDRLKLHCPELLQLVLQVPLFNPSPSGQRGDVTKSDDTPALMSERFGVPYLGKIPMDPNLLLACENGQSFMEAFPNSMAAAPFKGIVENLVKKCSSEHHE